MAKKKKTSSKKSKKKTTKKKSSKKSAKKSTKKRTKKTTKKTEDMSSENNATEKISSQTTLDLMSEEGNELKNDIKNVEPSELESNIEKAETSEPEKVIKEVIEVSDSRIDELERKKQQQLLEDQMPSKFWQKGAYTMLMDPTLVKSDELVKYDLSALLSEFTKEMLKEDIIDFRISGMAIYSAAKLHHKKIRDVIDEEEKVQLKELRERMKREIPKAMAQPLREPRKIATNEELFSAMRSAIIETMQKRELLRRRRENKIARREELKVIRSKGQLPKEILKHILGKNQTVQEMLQSWFDKIKAKIKLSDKDFTTYDEMVEDVIEIEEKESYGQKIKSIELFIALLFLSTNGKVSIIQGDDFDDITIKIPRYIV